MDLHDLFFQQNEAICHTAHQISDLSVSSVIVELAASELLFNAVFLGYRVKNRCYADNLQTIGGVKLKIGRTIRQIKPSMNEVVFHN